jgi:hypothetical protein
LHGEAQAVDELCLLAEVVLALDGKKSPACF